MIKLSKKGSYAIKAIIYIANNKKIVKVSKIALDEGISESLLRRIVADLEKSGILKTTKGRCGGVELGKDVSKISVFDILFSIGEELGIRDCTKGIACEKHSSCSTTDLYSKLQLGFNSLLKMYTVDRIIK